jgi:cysteine synthase
MVQDTKTMTCNPPDEERLIRVQPKLAHLARLIGNTHLLAIEFLFRGAQRTLYTKCEQGNLTGSIKDRMAFHILKTAYLEGAIKPTDTIAEATSGNTGISFAALGHALGHPVTIFMPDWMSIERTRLMQSFGATVVPVSREQGGFLEVLWKNKNSVTTKTAELQIAGPVGGAPGVRDSICCVKMLC